MTICIVLYSTFRGGRFFMSTKKVLIQNFVYTVLFGHNLDPLNH